MHQYCKGFRHLTQTIFLQKSFDLNGGKKKSRVGSLTHQLQAIMLRGQYHKIWFLSAPRLLGVPPYQSNDFANPSTDKAV